MKKRLFAVFLCGMLLFCGCEKRVDEQQLPEEHTEHANDKEDLPEHQGKLDAINPIAYGDVDGINLEEGSTIAVIGKCETGAFWEAVKAGAKQAVEDINKECGYEGKSKVKLSFSGPAKTENVDEQVNVLDEELSRYPVAVAISIIDVNACQTQFDIAAESDIPLVAFDSGSDYKGLLAMIATDNQHAGEEVAWHMSEKLEAGNVITIAHDSKSETANVRADAFNRAIKENYKSLNVEKTYYLDLIQKEVADEINAGTFSFDEEEAQGVPLPEEEKISADDISMEETMEYILKKHPDLNGIYATNVDAVKYVVDALDTAKRQNVTVMGYDEDENTMQALNDGKIEGLIVQNPFGMGYAAVVAAARSALSLGNEAYVDTGYVWVTKENLETEAVQKMLYTK